MYRLPSNIVLNMIYRNVYSPTEQKQNKFWIEEKNKEKNVKKK